MSDVWKGVALPWNNTIVGTLEPKSDEDILKSSVQWIVLTRLGERVMLPEFGSSLFDALFEPNDSTTAIDITRSVRSAVNRWDDRIIIEDVSVESVENKMEVKIMYKNSKDPKSNAMSIAAFQITPEGSII